MIMKHNETVDLLKCYAALLVFVCHAYIVSKETFGFEFSYSWQFFLKAPAWAGVWIFMIVSGFLAGNGFFTGKYSLDRRGIYLYYKDRFVKVILPTWIVISLIYILADTQVPDIVTVIRFLTCTFRGRGGATGVGATWYVFSIAWLYLMVPVFVYIEMKIEKKNTGNGNIYIILILIFTLLGLVYRIGGRYFGLEWYRWIYASPFGNIDLFLCGLIISRLRVFSNFNKVKIKQSILHVSLFVITLICAYCYYYGEGSVPFLLTVYRYIMPTAFLMIIGGGTYVLERNYRRK